MLIYQQSTFEDMALVYFKESCAMNTSTLSTSYDMVDKSVFKCIIDEQKPPISRQRETTEMQSQFKTPVGDATSPPSP